MDYSAHKMPQTFDFGLKQSPGFRCLNEGLKLYEARLFMVHYLLVQPDRGISQGLENNFSFLWILLFAVQDDDVAD
ncbi:hypothetical protein ES703_56400 [subsurface metagenome]